MKTMTYIRLEQHRNPIYADYAGQPIKNFSPDALKAS